MCQFFPLILCPLKEQRELLFVDAVFGYQTRANWGLGFTEVRSTARYLDGETRVSSRSQNIARGANVHYDRGHGRRPGRCRLRVACSRRTRR
jgi:hypothetical protein